MTSINHTEIKAYLFDLGGVLIDLNPQATIDAFEKLGLKNLQEQINHGHHNGLFEQLEKGSISRDEFIEAIQKQTPSKISEQQIINAWNKMLLTFPIERIKILEQLRQEKAIYLLSNTNVIHREYFSKSAEGYTTIEELFNQVFYSYQLGCSKPDNEPFLKVLDVCELKPQEILFLDDSEANINTAKKLGFKTMLITHESPIESIFKI